MDQRRLSLLHPMVVLLLTVPVTVVCGSNRIVDVDWYDDAQKIIEENNARINNVGVAKNVILTVGDGMGISTITGARVLKAQKEKKNFHESRLAWDNFPHTSLALTYCIDLITSDSSATANAFQSGIKTNFYTLGVNHHVKRGECETMTQDTKVKSALQMAHEQGKWTGIVTTTRVTHATPAAAYANTPSRDWETDSLIPEDQKDCVDIAKQLVMDNHHIRVLLGGGRMAFLSKEHNDPVSVNTTGYRTDGLNLMEMWQEKQLNKAGVDRNGVKLVIDQAGLNEVDASKTDYLLGLFSYTHMKYELDRNGEPSLTEMVEKAIQILSRNEKGFFLLVEGGRIDHAHHENKAHKALADTLAFSEAVQKAADMTNKEDTLIITTADHSHTFTIAGYPHPDSDILGVTRGTFYGVDGELGVALAEDDLPYLTLTYANGPGYLKHRTNGSLESGSHQRKNLSLDDAQQLTRGKDYVQDAAIPLGSETHAGEDVAVYAQGPMAHLFHGSQEQSYIAHVMMYAACLGPYSNRCIERPVLRTLLDAQNSADSAEIDLPIIVFITLIWMRVSLFTF